MYSIKNELLSDYRLINIPIDKSDYNTTDVVI